MAKDKDGNTPLHFASMQGNESVVHKFIAMGAKINAKDNQGVTPCFLANYCGHTRVLNILRNTETQFKENSINKNQFHNNSITTIKTKSKRNKIDILGFLPLLIIGTCILIGAGIGGSDGTAVGGGFGGFLVGLAVTAIVSFVIRITK